jgi:glucose repression regulatory protein TUP1
MYRPLVSVRIPELMDTLKAEFETLAHDVNMYKMQRDEFERKLNAQIQEMSNITQQINELERAQAKMKQQYEDEILRLRRQLESVGGSAVSFNNTNPASSATNSPTPIIGTNNIPANRNTVTIPSLDKARGGMLDSGVLPSTGLGMPSLPNGLNPLPGTSPHLLPGASPHPSPGRLPGAPGPGPAPANLQKRPELSNSPAPFGSGLPNLGIGQPLTGHSVSANSVSNLQNLPGVPAMTPLQGLNSGELRASEDNGLKSSRGSNSASSGALTSPSIKQQPQEESEGHDWVIGFNPAVSRRLDIDLGHTLEHDSVVCCVKFSADGKYLATGFNKSANVFDAETGKKVHTFTDESHKEGDLYIRSVCFSPDGRYLATGAEDKTIKIWDIERKVIKHDLQGHDLDIYSLDFSPNGQFLLSGSGDKKVKLWNVETGKVVFTLGGEEVGPKDGVTSVAMSPDGKLIAAGSLDRIVRLWDAETGYIRDRFEGHGDSVYSVAFSPDGKWLASGSLDKTLKLWDLGGRARSRCRTTLSGHKDFVLSVAFSPCGNWLVSGSKDRAVQFWDPRTGITHMRLHGHKNSVISVALTGDKEGSGGRFATGSGDNRARIWNYRVGNFGTEGSSERI